MAEISIQQFISGLISGNYNKDNKDLKQEFQQDVDSITSRLGVTLQSSDTNSTAPSPGAIPQSNPAAVSFTELVKNIEDETYGTSTKNEFTQDLDKLSSEAGISLKTYDINDTTEISTQGSTQPTSSSTSQPTDTKNKPDYTT